MPPQAYNKKRDSRTRAEKLMDRYGMLRESKLHDLRKLQHFSMFFDNPCIITVMDFSYDNIIIIYSAGKGRFACIEGNYVVHPNSYMIVSGSNRNRIMFSESFFKFPLSQIPTVNIDDFSDAIFYYIYLKKNLNFATTRLFNPICRSRDDGYFDVRYLSFLSLCEVDVPAEVKLL